MLCSTHCTLYSGLQCCAVPVPVLLTASSAYSYSYLHWPLLTGVYSIYTVQVHTYSTYTSTYAYSNLLLQYSINTYELMYYTLNHVNDSYCTHDTSTAQQQQIPPPTSLLIRFVASFLVS